MQAECKGADYAPRRSNWLRGGGSFAPLKTPSSPAGIVSFEFAGSLAVPREMLAAWGETGQVYAALNLGLDYLFLISYFVGDRAGVCPDCPANCGSACRAVSGRDSACLGAGGRRVIRPF